MKRLNQTGSHIFGIALLVLALGIIGFAGYTVSQHNKKNATTTTTSTATVPAAIDSKADLSTTAKSLDESSSDLNNSVNGDSLDSNLNDLL